MNQEPAVATANDWAVDAALLIEKPTAVWGAERPLALRIRELLLHEQAAVPTSVRNQVIHQALSVADGANTAGDIEANALREYLRGLFWLPREEDSYDGAARQPPPPDAEFVAGGAAWNSARVGQRRAWGMRRYWREKGEAHRHGSRSDAVNSGSKLTHAAKERLIADLEAFFEDEAALDDCALVIDRSLAHERYLTSRRTSPALHRRLRDVATSLGRLSPLYPTHLSVQDLVADRLATVLHAQDEEDERDPRRDPTTLASVHTDKVIGGSALTVLASARRGVLLGDPGSGKSTLARARVIDAIESGPGGVAAYVRATALLRALNDTSESWLEAVARIALALRVDAPRAQDVDELVRLLATEPSALLVIDGLDEVLDPADRATLVDLLDELPKLPGDVMLTTRHTGYRHLHGWADFAPLAVSPEAYSALLQRWLGVDDPTETLRSLWGVFGVQGLNDMVGHPVLAGIVTSLAISSGDAVAASRPELYHQAIAHLCQRRWKAPEHDERSRLEVLALIAGYEEAAWRMVAVTTVTSYASLAALGIDVELLRSGELLQSSPLDSDADIDQPWTWLHSSFADYLVSVRLHRLLNTDRTEAARLLREAIQYPEGWTESLRFLVEAASPAQRSWIAAEWDALIAEGDPGGVIGRVAGPLMSVHGIEINRSGSAEALLRRFVDNAQAEADARALAQPSMRDKLMRITAGDHSEALLRRPLLDASHAEDPGLVDAYWAAFVSLSYPDNLALAFAMGDCLFERVGPDAPDDQRLATWMAATRRHGGVSKLAPHHHVSKELRDAVHGGRYGDWGLFCMALQEPWHVDPTDQRPYARLGRRLTGLDADIDRPECVAALRPVLDGFAVADLDDPARCERLIRAVHATARPLKGDVGAEGPADIDVLHESLVLLSGRLGGLHPWRRLERIATNPDDLARLVRAEVSRLIETHFHPEPLARAALRLYRKGTPAPASAIPTPINHLVEVHDERDWDRAFEVLDWLTGTDPDSYDLLHRFVSLPRDERFAIALIERICPRLDPDSSTYDYVVSSLASGGALAKWRDYLLALSPDARR